MIPLCKQNKSEKILDTTNEEYNIEIKAYKSGKVIMVTLYTMNLIKQLNQGAVNALIAQLGEENGAVESYRKIIQSSRGEIFSIRCESNGNIYIAYAYNNISKSSQIAGNLTYIAK